MSDDRKDHKLGPLDVAMVRKSGDGLELITRDVLDELAEAREQLAAMRERADRVEQDARRYRWLRTNWTTMSCNATRATLSFNMGEPKWADFSVEDIDTAIDAAIARAEGVSD